MLHPSYLADAYNFSHFYLAFQTADSFMRFQYKPEEFSFLQDSRYLLHLNIHSVLKVWECLEKISDSFNILQG